MTDDGGLTATDTATVSVVYVFSGFFSPVDNLPVFNVAKAGQAIPIRFSLNNGDQGLSIFAAGYPKSEQITCDSTEPTDGIEESGHGRGNGLSDETATDEYTYVRRRTRRGRTAVGSSSSNSTTAHSTEQTSSSRDNREC